MRAAVWSCLAKPEQSWRATVVTDFRRSVRGGTAEYWRIIAPWPSELGGSHLIIAPSDGSPMRLRIK